MGHSNEKDNSKYAYFECQVCQVLDAGHPEHKSRSYAWRPATDIYETDAAIIIKTELAGMQAKDFNITFIDHLLTINGVRKDSEAKLNYHCLEIPYGAFQVRVLIPGKYKEADISARYENGYLYVLLPKAL
ncbi:MULTISPECIES: Hsp20/alpha crystallin family protein [Legionella]|uniref:Hsp20/alpha crystallin family protein n=1 Tax=Legionella TaxID=445 RepID=UPI000F8EAC17|nr:MULTISPECIES: Hsp20/alpha crystallin family protein [Legionella]MCP0913711.1 Hsp20/alpha crystallin family protein [Legionella sp. 27cVA30]RUQ99338.1 Hsp20/alpha crystallin family protein [Legionella septentrionalis]